MKPAGVTKPSKREQTRARVIQAAIDCIYEEGFNAAHTNRICARAELSWGVLQYHFGDKDGLLSAVLETIFADFSEQLNTGATLEGPLDQRIRQFIELVWRLISQPAYRVSIAILRNADRSSQSRINPQQLINTWGNEIGTLWDEVFADQTGRHTTAKRIMFAALRGFADELNPVPGNANQDLHQELEDLACALTHLLEQ